MKKTSFSTSNYIVDKSGIVRHKKTGQILTCIGHPSKRQKFRLWWKIFRTELKDWAKAAGSATNGSWNHWL